MEHGERKISSADKFDDGEDPEHSRWIHRDKLAQIESQELQAAGIILPRARAASKSSRREHSRDQQSGGIRSEHGQKRQRIGSSPNEEEDAPQESVWDLRTPEEAAEDQGDMFQDVSGGIKGISRIPVSKTSPVPIPLEHLERNTPMRRTAEIVPWEDEPISFPRSRGRSQSVKAAEATTVSPAKRMASENSPSKKTPGGARKGSAPRNASAPQKPKPKATTATRETNSGTRPPTRSGELGHSNSVKRPEGDPPWLASMYKPDPRLPPDQQLLPTVAKRLQQEQWEKEGKFGNAYDTSFRPMNDDPFPTQPEPQPQPPVLEVEKKPEDDSGWPLRGPKSPALSTGRPGTAGTGTYSTMPKITTGIPQGVGPLPSPRPPVRLQEPPEDAKGSGGCCGCTIM